MSNIVKMSDYSPHMEGPAKCLVCKHEWHAVAPLGTVALDCPECHTSKGVFVYMVVPEICFQCRCGEYLFHLHPNGAQCCNCGIAHTLAELYEND